MYNNGCRSLIASILNQAIRDALSYKRPRTPLRRITKFKRNKYLSLLIALSPHLVIEFRKKYLLSATNHISSSLLLYIAKVYSHILDIASKKPETADEKFSWEARNFISDKNKLFVHYCTLLDIEPAYLEQKVHAYIFKFDNG